jgi:preprotein translocase SecE subunit
MARDRKRAKQRRAREERRTSQTRPGARRTDRREEGPLAVERRSTEEAPDSVEEISGDAELAKEAIRGAPTDEVDHPVDDPDAKAEVYEDELSDDEGGGGVLAELVDRDEDLGEEQDDQGLDAEDEDAADVAAGRAGRRRGGGSREAASTAVGRPAARRPERARRGNPVIAFLRACWAELQRVQWPDRRQVGQATAVVLGFVVIAGSYLGLMDFIWQKVVTYLLDL